LLALLAIHGGISKSHDLLPSTGLGIHHIPGVALLAGVQDSIGGATGGIGH